MGSSLTVLLGCALIVSVTQRFYTLTMKGDLLNVDLRGHLDPRSINDPAYYDSIH